MPFTRFRRPDFRPAWWPPGEPWPPRSSDYLRAQRRQHFARRAGWYTFLPVWMLVWVLASRVPWSTPAASPLLRGAWLLAVCGVIAGVIALVLRRIAGPVADLVSAADRIAQRDYGARVDVPRRGPRWIRDIGLAFNAMATQLDAQETARQRLMADIAHELRTPLAVVQGTLEGLLDGVYPRDDRRLQGLLDDTKVLSRLVEDLRTLSTADSGALALVKEPTDLVALAHDVAHALTVRASEAGIALTVTVAPHDDVAALEIDPVRVREVLTNLVVNALRHTPAGGQVTIALHDHADRVEVRVSDTGQGIAAGELARIFDRFYKGAASTGSGLGLTIARSLVAAHGGSIAADSTPGHGTTIAFSLPR